MFESGVRFFDGVANTKIGGYRVARVCGLAALVVSGNIFPAQLQAAESDGEWNFMIAPLFLWGMSIDGDSAIDGNALPLDLNFKDDVMENLDAVFTLHFEARKDDLLLFVEYQYVSLDPTIEASLGSVPVNAGIDFTVATAELGAGYTVSHTDTTRWEVLGGLRWIEHELDVDVDGPEILPDSITGGDDWYHGFVGGRVTTSLSENWRLLARADYGYGGSGNDAWHLNAMADYRFKNWGSAFVGYRHMKFDYSSRGYAYDAEQRGPMAGISIYW
jgi:hypothetical protein